MMLVNFVSRSIKKYGQQTFDLESLIHRRNEFRLTSCEGDCQLNAHVLELFTMT